MDQLIKQITERTGTTENQAKQAVETVLAFLKGAPPIGGGQIGFRFPIRYIATRHWSRCLRHSRSFFAPLLLSG